MSIEEKKQILIADDEEHIAKLVQFKLSREGYEVQVAHNGQEAIDMLEAAHWALLILDITMPIKDGWEVLKYVRSQPSLKLLPVLILTAKGGQKDLAHAADLGATQYLKKPFDPNELASAVRLLMESHEQRG